MNVQKGEKGEGKLRDSEGAEGVGRISDLKVHCPMVALMIGMAGERSKRGM